MVNSSSSPTVATMAEVPSAIVTTQSTNKRTTAIIAGSAVAGSLIALVAIGFCIFLIMQRRVQKYMQDMENRIPTPQVFPVGGASNTNIAVPRAVTERGTLSAETAAPVEASRERIRPPLKGRTRLIPRRYSLTLNHAVEAEMPTVLIPHGRKRGTKADAAHMNNVNVRSQVAFLQDSNEEMRVNVHRVMHSVQRLEDQREPTDHRRDSIPDVPPPTYMSLSL
ncbi:hypothetical protein EV360DRAFT_87331 [Lentinula raphanica]|nr:hypothetical protein EV360DRAFT_87331 [Lentinula raphanica]